MLDFLGSQASVKILELFCRNPNKEFYSKEIMDELNLSKATNLKWLKKLEEKEILAKSSKGRRTYYKLKLGNPIARQVRVLFTLSELISAFKDVGGLNSAYLVGKAARGTSPPDAAIELLILTRGDKDKISELVEEVSEKIGREIDEKVMAPLEYSQLSKEKPNEHERLEREKIRLTF